MFIFVHSIYQRLPASMVPRKRKLVFSTKKMSWVTDHLLFDTPNASILQKKEIVDLNYSWNMVHAFQNLSSKFLKMNFNFFPEKGQRHIFAGNRSIKLETPILSFSIEYYQCKKSWREHAFISSNKERA